MTSRGDVMIVCSIVLVGKPLHMHRQYTVVHLRFCRGPHQLTILTESSECFHLVSKPVFVPVTYI